MLHLALHFNVGSHLRAIDWRRVLSLLNCYFDSNSICLVAVDDAARFYTTIAMESAIKQAGSSLVAATLAMSCSIAIPLRGIAI